MQRGLSAQKNRNAHGVGHANRFQICQVVVAMYPNRVESTSPQFAADAVIDRARHAQNPAAMGREHQGKEGVVITLLQWRVPLDMNAEALVDITAHRNVGAEKHDQINIRLLSNPSEKRGYWIG
jgi:hypothetical protein